jgi:NAD(P)-dependent dehydrogenase (short-subunit alcohol dehydrogenase family)
MKLTLCHAAANYTIRFAIAHSLSKAGATVILACRRAPAGEEAARAISRSTSGRVIFLQCDLESIASVNEVGFELRSYHFLGYPIT